METLAKTKWVLDPSHSEVGFKVKHLMISTVTGSFGKFDVEVSSSKEDFSDAKIVFTADTASISTNNEQRDGHLKSADFFDTEAFPTIRFESTSFERVKGADYILNGNLTIKGVTRTLAIPVEYGGSVRDPWGNTKAAFSIDTRINRKEFGLGWNAALETGGVVVSDEIRVLAEIQLLENQS